MLSERKILGIDEAGRGPVVGPMVIAGVLLVEEQIPNLIRIGVKDSKKLTPKAREKLLSGILAIAEDQYVKIISAAEIDTLRRTENLNQIEAYAMAEIIRRLSPDEVQLGSVDVDEKRFGSEVMRLTGKVQTISSVHHAEEKFPAVAAASIVAKTTRDRAVADLRKEYGDFGSGYPSDPKTRSFLRMTLEA
ncbi:MAG: ribonuclease HII, partial [Candidatus Methanosuratus sp.]|nr:ribonuclease HII [Candidatus Methanosuratincola sp.]